MKKHLPTWIYVTIASVIFFCAVLLFNVLLTQRLDLTEDQRYTLSEGTEAVLENLEEPITFHFFYSRRLATGLPDLQRYGRRVEEMLKEFVSLSDGRITLEVIEPEPFSSEEDLAVSFGVQNVPLGGTGEQFYFGLAATNSIDNVEVIPFLDPNREPMLEYDLTRIVQDLATPKQPVIGVMSWLPLNDPKPGDSFAVMEMIRQVFTVQDVATSATEIPDSIDVLMVVHPASASAQTLYAIDQFVMRGGNLLMFVDPYSEIVRQTGLENTASNPAKLLTSWGLELDGDNVVGDRLTGVQVNAGQTSTSAMGITTYLPWVTLTPDYLNREDIATAELQQVNLATAGALTVNAAEGVEATPLMHSSRETMMVPAVQLMFMADPVRLLQDFESSDTERNFAVRLTGTLPSAYPDGPPATDEEKQDAEAPEPLDSSIAPVSVVVIADTDMLSDRFWVRSQGFMGYQMQMPFADNGAMVVNLLEQLSGSEELISLRSRSVSSRPFTVLEELNKEAEMRFREKEIALQEKLRETEQQLKSLREGAGAENQALMTAEQTEAMRRVRDEILATRKELRKVQHALYQDIEAMGTTLKFINILLMPILVAIVALLVFARQRRRQHRYPAG